MDRWYRAGVPDWAIKFQDGSKFTLTRVIQDSVRFEAEGDYRAEIRTYDCIPELLDKFSDGEQIEELYYCFDLINGETNEKKETTICLAKPTMLSLSFENYSECVFVFESDKET